MCGPTWRPANVWKERTDRCSHASLTAATISIYNEDNCRVARQGQGEGQSSPASPRAQNHASARPSSQMFLCEMPSLLPHCLALQPPGIGNAGALQGGFCGCREAPPRRGSQDNVHQVSPLGQGETGTIPVPALKGLGNTGTTSDPHDYRGPARHITLSKELGTR